MVTHCFQILKQYHLSRFKIGISCQIIRNYPFLKSLKSRRLNFWNCWEKRFPNESWTTYFDYIEMGPRLIPEQVVVQNFVTTIYYILLKKQDRPGLEVIRVHSQTQNQVKWLATCGHLAASSQPFRFIADFIGLPYFSGFPSGLKSHVLISHDFLSQSKFGPLPRDREAMCSRPASKHQKKFCFVSKQACIYCIRSED